MNTTAATPSELLERLARPQVRLNGPVDEAMLRHFNGAFEAAADAGGPVVVELTTSGGDADVARRIATDVRLHRERTGVAPLFLGKTAVFSAGVTIMAGFPPDARWLTAETVLLIHGRTLERSIELSEPLLLARTRVQALLAEIEHGIALERRGFEELIAGSRIALDDLLQRSRTNWYLPAAAALEAGLVAGVV